MSRTILFLLTAVTLSSAQPFTRITAGAPVTDGGDSRSVNWIDYDGDGFLDLFVSNGPAGGENNFLYRNNGDGTFAKVTGSPVVSDGRPSDGSTWGDYDNDGDPDLFVANWYGQHNLFYRNDGNGTFVQVNAPVLARDGGYSESAAWGDYDNDGWLDLVVCNSAGNLKNFLYRNTRDGSFAKVTSGPVVSDLYHSRNADWIDIDGDGDPDLFIANEEGEHENLYWNDGAGSFTSASLPSLLANGGNTASSSWEDVDNDGDFDVFLANYGGQKNRLLLNNGNGTFSAAGAPFTEDVSNSFGSAFGDTDNDGDLDLFVTNAFTAGTTKNFFYRNNGNGTFVRDSSFDADLGWSYGCAFGDYDKDGFLDLFVAKCFNATENNALYRNNGGGGHWLRLDLAGKRSNRSAIGAVVRAKAAVNGTPVWQMRRVAGQSGYCGQTLQLHFGLGAASAVDSLVIRWPSGITQVLTNVPADTGLTIIEDTSLVTSVRRAPSAPLEGALEQNFPNPFNPSTLIAYRLEHAADAALRVYDTLGRVVATLAEGEHAAGRHTVRFDAAGLSAGVYYYRLTAGAVTETKRMAYMK